MKGYLNSWWHSRGGGKEVIRLAVPLIISAGSLALMQFVDRAFLTWFDPVTVGASFCSGQIFWAATSFPFSIAAYTVAFISQYNGAKEYERIGKIVWQGIFIGLAVYPLLFFLYPFCTNLFVCFGHSDEMQRLETSYFFGSLWGGGALVASQAVESFFVGRKKMKTVMAVSLSAVGINGILDYLMIFGCCGIPRMGIAGAALATSISQILRFIVFFALMIIDEYRSEKRYALFKGCRIVPLELWNLLKYGGMGGVQFFTEMASFAVFITLLGKLGEVEAASSAIAVNLNGMTFLPIIGMGSAVMTMVGNAIGEENQRLAKRTVYSSAAVGLTFTGFFTLAFLLVPHYFLAVFAAKDPVSFAPYFQMTVNLLRFVAVYLFFDTINIVFCSAIKGAGDTRFVMCVTICLVPLIAVFPWIGIYFFHLGVYWCWTVLTLYICLTGVIFLCRFLKGKWMSMNLVKPKLRLKQGKIAG